MCKHNTAGGDKTCSNMSPEAPVGLNIEHSNALTLKAIAIPLQIASAYIFAMGVATIIRKNTFANTFEPKIWDCSGCFLIRIENVCGKAILICLTPSLVGVMHVIYDSIFCSKTPFEGLITINKKKKCPDLCKI